MDTFTKTIIGLIVTTCLSWVYLVNKVQDNSDKTYSNGYLRHERGTIDTIHQSEENTAPWHKFTKKEIEQNKIDKHFKYFK